jgi:glycosyltransferase involved in cell wall biosynthesis
MNFTLSGVVPFYNNNYSVVSALRSLERQTSDIIDLIAVDDCSIDGSNELATEMGYRVFRQPANLGRGAARQRCLLEASGDLVVCCDATNVLPPDFVERLLPWFDDPKVAAVYGWIQDPNPHGVVGRWRSRHLFKAGFSMQVTRSAPLITYGTILRRSAVLDVGNFDPMLRHSEDVDLGERLLKAEYDIVFDPRVPVFCNVKNSLAEVLERYWRWYAGADESVSWSGYIRNIIYSIRAMVHQDLHDGDPIATLISLVCPHYQFWRSYTKL